MATSTEIRQKVIELIGQLPSEKLPEALYFLEFLAKADQAILSSSEEAVLVQIIQRHLPPDEQNRLDELRDRNEWDDLTEAEHQELLAYEDQLEQQNVERLEALMKLADLRKVDLVTLNHQFMSSS